MGFLLFGEFRKERERGEVKHLSQPREEKTIVIPLVTASESGKGQTELLPKGSKDVELQDSGLSSPAESNFPGKGGVKV